MAVVQMGEDERYRRYRAPGDRLQCKGIGASRGLVRTSGRPGLHLIRNNVRLEVRDGECSIWRLMQEVDNARDDNAVDGCAERKFAPETP